LSKQTNKTIHPTNCMSMMSNSVIFINIQKQCITRVGLGKSVAQSTVLYVLFTGG